ncbi:beta-barrel assembly-enhancing protease [Microcystis aeruginosa NIES-1211]|jgi:cytochrome c-type biogenesis protein CcmH/NrfG|uniref:Beta-barrel assembly-enhancing protease n=1 Tax=Microcystis aeruginosa NIES-2519 TaxID=2303981 RepID=A0A5A5R1M5_MICAE|nr:tetratricopeptide repeat protein [Microcystis aeruginosa]GBL13821.1 beta-barrel assembly-enhancing protease [Microcystis aeruginosa NIES-1211]GCA69673.1 beta-barrel assembly-enhancing protease [Microcystis aeruginosa NIES-2519]
MPKKNNDTLKRVLIVSSGLVFLALMVVPTLGLLKNNNSNSTQGNQPGQEATIPPEKLAAMVKGYEKILEREPDNPTALQGLAEARLQLKDFIGAREPLEKLYQKYPDNLEVMLVLYGTRLQTQDVSGAKSLLEKLVKDYPQEPKFKEELTRLNQAIAAASQQQTPEPKK